MPKSHGQTIQNPLRKRQVGNRAPLPLYSVHSFLFRFFPFTFHETPSSSSSSAYQDASIDDSLIQENPRHGFFSTDAAIT
ncbi:hypothetical protein PanWU01x14_002400 [Parasponia andersonii]|uniref:Uncharacterized protein n=1 Tax=Parasponia andersonii TaxID=3476 RepID=A0A2P5E571_PARAD|nr:hypothetical protein PanWU01x14_002400 [Parasponia andersonii]